MRPVHTLLFRTSLLIGLVLAGAFGTVRAAPTNSAPEVRRPENWAIKLDKPGLQNLHQITPDLYRGAQPTTAGMAELKNLGIKTVVNLRAFHSDDDRLKNTGLEYERFYMKPWHGEDEDVVRFLKIVTATNRMPVFVHCQHGADRTGVMCAMYRVAVQGWSKDEAIREMTRGGYGFHPEWKNLVRYVESVDVAAIRRQAGIVEK